MGYHLVAAGRHRMKPKRSVVSIVIALVVASVVVAELVEAEARTP
jgi:hypothetical protein